MVDLPHPLPTRNIVVDEQDHRKVMVSVFETRASVDMYLAPHSEYEAVIPDDATECSLYDEPTDGSPTTSLPDEDKAVFIEAVDTLIDQHGFELEFPNNETRYGVCTACLGKDNGEELLFTVHLVRATA